MAHVTNLIGGMGKREGLTCRYRAGSGPIRIGICSKVIIEAAVFLDDEDDVLNLVQSRRLAIGRLRCSEYQAGPENQCQNTELTLPRASAVEQRNGIELCVLHSEHP